MLIQVTGEKQALDNCLDFFKENGVGIEVMQHG
jgi:hypothetical protein